MTKVIIKSDQTLDKQYQDGQETLSKFHDHPTSLPKGKGKLPLDLTGLAIVKKGVGSRPNQVH
ncbi:MAG: hypothetical protein ACXABD_22705 [Candidatus Thorarchaeota archaeon]|jgi:hypothetical protein